MRIHLAVLLATLVSLVPATASAAPSLIGRSGGPLRLLDRDLRVVKGSAPIPRRHLRTLLSPDGMRFVAGGDRDLIVYDRRTGKRLSTRPVPRNSSPLLWPSRRRLVLTDMFGRNLIKLDLATGRRRTVAIPKGNLSVVGEELRVLTLRPGEPAIVHEVRPSGSVRRSVTLPLPPETFTSTTISEWVGGKLLIQDGIEDGPPLLVSFDGGAATVRTPDLAPGSYQGLSPTLLIGTSSTPQGVARTLARIDPDTGAVLRTVDVPQVSEAPSFEGAIPYAGGAIVGGGRLRYDADLQVAATNPAADPDLGPQAVRLGDRLYVPTRDCTTKTLLPGTFEPTTFRIVDADSLRTIGTRRLYKVGRIGGSFVQSFNCD